MTPTVEALAKAEEIVKTWLASTVSLIDWDDQEALDELSKDFALALTDQARDFPICTEHQRECTFCGTCLSESDSVVILKAEVKKLQDSMIRHFQREHLEGEGPEIDRWKRKLTEQMREREKERTEMLAIADRIRLELDGQAREIERLKAEKAACPGCATQTLTKGRLPHSCDAARATWEAAVKIADDEINNAPDDKSGKYADGYVRGAGAVCNKLSERARDAAQDCPGINATHHDRHLRCEQCDSAQGGKNG